MPLSKRLETGLTEEVRGSGKSLGSPMGLATSDFIKTCHFRASRDRADLGSYGKWQDPDLANFKASRDRADLGSYGEWQDPDLANFNLWRNGKI